MAALLAGENGVVTYTPDRKFKGADSFTYVVGDDSEQTNEGTVRVTVRNGVPVAVPDESSTQPNSSVEVDVLANDHDPNGDDLGVAEHDATSAEGGTVSRTNGGLTYEPPLGFRGVDSFTYRSTDGDATSDRHDSDRRRRQRRPGRGRRRSHPPAGTGPSTSRCWPTTPTPTATP